MANSTPITGVMVRQLAAGDARDWASCRAIRHEVFCIEQGVPPDLEWDGLDDRCCHFLAELAGRAVGTARTRGYRNDTVGKIERVAVRAEARGQGIGRALVEAAIVQLAATGYRTLLLNAQARSRTFYENLGFVQTGPPFDEAGIPHIQMSMPAPRTPQP